MPTAPGLSKADPFQEAKADPWNAPGGAATAAHVAAAAPPGMAAAECTGAAAAAAHAAAAGASTTSTPLPQCKALHHKDVEKPTKYTGNTDAWLPWAKSFKKFLRRTNATWLEILF